MASALLKRLDSAQCRSGPSSSTGRPLALCIPRSNGKQKLGVRPKLISLHFLFQAHVAPHGFHDLNFELKPLCFFCLSRISSYCSSCFSSSLVKCGVDPWKRFYTGWPSCCVLSLNVFSCGLGSQLLLSLYHHLNNLANDRKTNIRNKHNLLNLILTLAILSAFNIYRKPFHPHFKHPN